MTDYLLDTNLISELVRPHPNDRVTDWISSVNETSLFLSVLTIGELSKGIAGMNAGKRRTVLEDWLATELKPRFEERILPINASIATRWGVLSARAKQQGHSLGVIDGLIAATALSHDLTVVTRNVADFAPTKVRLLNPWE